MKGTYEGLYLGLYENTSNEADKCLDKLNLETLDAINDELVICHFNDTCEYTSSMAFLLMGQLAEIVQEYDHETCKMALGYGFTFDMVVFCKLTDNCSLGNLASKAQKNMFSIMGKLSDLGELVPKIFNESLPD